MPARACGTCLTAGLAFAGPDDGVRGHGARQPRRRAAALPRRRPRSPSRQCRSISPLCHQRPVTWPAVRHRRSLERQRHRSLVANVRISLSDQRRVDVSIPPLPALQRRLHVVHSNSARACPVVGPFFFASATPNYTRAERSRRRRARPVGLLARRINSRYWPRRPRVGLPMSGSRVWSAGNGG